MALLAVICPAVTPRLVASRPPLIADDVSRLSNSLLLRGRKDGTGCKRGRVILYP